MSVRSIQIEGYRSLVNFRFRLGQITVVTGPNGTGKSNLYRALHLLNRAAEGSFARSLAEEGGMHSAMWSGKQRASKGRREIAITLNSDPLSYKLVAGLPTPAPGDQRLPNSGTLFIRDPDIKEERIWAGDVPRPSSTLMERKGSVVTLADAEGRKQMLPMTLHTGESVLSQVLEPEQYPQLISFQHRLSQWRF